MQLVKSKQKITEDILKPLEHVIYYKKSWMENPDK